MTQSNANIGAIVRDPVWYPHRYDPGHDAFQFRPLSRDQHRSATFLTDEYLGTAVPTAIRRSDIETVEFDQAPLHFIFHSAFCCSTVLARAFDIEGVSMGLKEPVLLNDIIGWQHRGGTAAQIAPVLDDGLALLSRPFAGGEAVVIKPSNVVNGLAPGMLSMRPEARALLLHCPLRTYLGSIAKKGMTGRLWARELLVKQLAEGLHGFGYSAQDYIGQTDLQAAAIGWLAQHALFLKMIGHFPGRIRTIDSATLMADPARSMAALAGFYGLDVDVEAMVAGPAFTRHSKFGNDFSSEARDAEVGQSVTAHGDEIDKVLVWADAVAKSVGVPMALPAPMLS